MFSLVSRIVDFGVEALFVEVSALDFGSGVSRKMKNKSPAIIPLRILISIKQTNVCCQGVGAGVTSFQGVSELCQRIASLKSSYHL